MESQSPNSPPSTPANPTPPTRLKVLIIDDEVVLCEMLQDMLEEYNYETRYAENSESALKLMPEFHPTVALVDFRLGEVTGIEVAHRLKELDQDLPVILMTAYPSLDLAVKAIQSDIYDFLSKPVDKTYLLRSINKAAEKRNLSEENRNLILSLKQSNAALDKLNRLKSKFLSIVTHDLRVPLTSIRGYSELLHTEKNLTEAERDKCFITIEKSVERMNGLIANLMDIVSIEAGKLRVERVDMDYAAVCQEMKEGLAPVAESNKVTLDWQIPPSALKILGDSNRLHQVLSNIVSNAFKHVSANKGKILIKVSVQDEPSGGKAALTEVIDNGEGISAEDQAKIFEQFYQVESSPTRREGLGLGLAISKEIVQAHQGRIGVNSDGLGKGTKFWFTIPLAG